jgi:hypothetical protein
MYGGHIGITWFLVIGCMSRAHTQYKIRASKRLGATKRAITAIIMHSDKTSLREA